MSTAGRDGGTTLVDRPRPAPAGPRLDIATLCLSGTLEDKLAAAAAAGFRGVEIFEDDLIASSWSPAEIRQHCVDLGLSIDLYQPFRDFEAVPPDVFSAHLRRAERKFDVLEQLGAGTLLVCSSTAADAVADDDLAAEQLHTLAARAAERGLRIAYEALAWGRFVNTYEHSWRIVRRADHPALGLCLDSFHVLCRGSDLAGLRVIPGAKVFFVQVADAPRLQLDVLQVSRHHRLFPGQGSFDLTSFVGQVLATGYSGPLSLEVFNDVVRQADPRRAAVDAMRSLLALQETVATSGPPTIRDRVRGAGLPPAPRLAGHVFTELAVDEVSGPAVARALTALGFTHAGQHRTKPVQLWQQGGARVLLNATPRGTAERGAAAVTALAVESSNPAASAGRAERLLAPVLPRTRRADEADLASVAAPDGTAVFFVRTDAGDKTGWLADFVPTGNRPTPSGQLTGTDHVSLTASVDDFDRTALFYRSVLGLQPEATTELAAPFGLIRSRGAADPAHQVRITLNVALLRRGGWAPAVPYPQHVAFGTDDAIASAMAMRAAGAPVLEIPGNYYDDLDARLALPPDLLAAMRAYSVLYDRDEDGEYLHFYTDLLGSRVFFEVVQRIGSYGGYGAANAAPVRMAAHRRRRLTRATTHDYSIAHLTCLGLSAPDLVDAAAAAGYRYVGLRLTRVTPDEPHYPLATDPALMRATLARLAATGVQVHDIELARVGPQDDPRSFRRILEAGAELGARHVIAQLPDPDPDRKVEHFAVLCDLARPLGLTVNLEFCSWTETPDLAEATRVLRAAGRPNAGMLVDLLHFARSGSSVAELRKLPREWFHFAHVCDAPAEVPTSTEGLIYTARCARLFPGTGGIDVRGILAALPAGIPYALEIPHTERAAQVGQPEYARLAVRAAQRYLDAPPAR
jgi:sugar phosphate isomerase/epimerase/4-hydroxyphenylpyruvate dioxygenase-like putative hemolysin